MLTYHKQIHVDKRTTMKNQNRSAALARPAMKLRGGGASTSLLVSYFDLILLDSFVLETVNIVFQAIRALLQSIRVDKYYHFSIFVVSNVYITIIIISIIIIVIITLITII